MRPLLPALLLLSIAACTKAPAPAGPDAPVTVYLPTSLTGPDARKGRLLRNAAELFVRENPRLRLEVADTASDPAKAAHLALTFASKPGPKLVFGPPSSEGNAALVALTETSNYPQGTWFLAQVTAGSSLHEKLRALSAFVPAKRYFAGAVLMLQNSGGKFRRAIVLVREGPAYFREVADGIKGGLAAHKVEFTELSVPEKISPEFLARWNKLGVGARDLVVVVDNGDPRRWRALSAARGFGEALKLAAYGNGQKNTWHVAFWHPLLRYGNDSSCRFRAAYEKEYGEAPDFHAAYLYATLEAARAFGYADPFPLEGKTAATILGTLGWDANGSAKGIRPAFASKLKGRLTLAVPPAVDGICGDITREPVDVWHIE